MRLVFFTHGGVLYGANLSMIDLMVGLRGYGVECMVVHADQGPIEEKLRHSDIPSACIPFRRCVHWRSPKPRWHPRRWVSEFANLIRAVRNQKFNERQSARLTKAVFEFGADGVVSNTSGTVVGLAVAKRLGIPHIWHIREFGDLDWDYYPDFGIDRRRMQILESAKVICVSNAVAAHHSQQCGLGIGAGLVAIHDSIASGEELEKRSLAIVANPSSHRLPFTFVLTGFVKYSKGQFDAVSALAKLVGRGFDVRLVVAGQGATDELRAHAESLGVADAVEILGHMPDLSEIYQKADCGLMCSVAEGFGRVTAEYMSWGKPVIGRNSGATPEIVRHEETGLLYDGDFNDLAVEMEKIILDDVLRQRLGKGALSFASRSFSHDINAERFLSAVRPVIEATTNIAPLEP